MRHLSQAKVRCPEVQIDPAVDHRGQRLSVYRIGIGNGLDAMYDCYFVCSALGAFVYRTQCLGKALRER